MFTKTLEKTAPSTTTYTLHEYAHKFDAGLALMWNESDDQWPGTFNEGVPQTEERVAEWMDHVEAVIKFVIVEDQTEKVVGYGDLWEDRARARACYVALLNVHPAHQGKSLARRMLTRMVDWCVENGYGRLTIGTWPSNLKAMPLYKKVGFFWQPDTNVHMENYVPAVRLLSFAQDYFAAHDWYRTYDRALEQVEDDMRHPQTGDMDIYILRWEAGDDLIEAVFDQKAQALTGLATNDFAAYASVEEGEPAQGAAYQITWTLINTSDAPMQVALTASADDGIELDYQTSLTLQPGARRELSTAYRVAVDAPKFHIDNHDIPTPKIASQLTINGEPLEFATGLRYRPAVEFSAHPKVISLLPGTPQTIHLQLQNRVKRPLEGRINIAPVEGLAAEWSTHAFTAEASGYYGVPLTLTAAQGGYYALPVSVTFQDGVEEITTHPQQLPVVAVAPAGWAAGEGEDELILENDYVRITCKAKNGSTNIWNKAIHRKQAQLLEELGPAFVPWDLYEQTYDLNLHTVEGGSNGANAVSAIMTVRSTRFPGLVVGREITINASPLVTVRHWVANNSEETHENLQLRPCMRIWRDITHHVTIPLQDRMVRENAGQFGNTHGDLPEEPEKYAEPWTAYEQYGQAFGMIWPETNVERIQSSWGRRFFILSLGKLAPDETRSLPPSYIYAGPGDWHTVQQACRRLRGTSHTVAPDAPLAEAKRHFDIDLTPAPLVTVDDEITAALRIETTREYQLNGEAVIYAPPGWTAAPQQVAVSEVNNAAPAETPVVLRATKPNIGAAQGQLSLQTDGFDASRPFSVIRLGRRAGTVQVSAAQKAGHEVWRLDNGHHAWDIAPAFNGCVVGWHKTGRSSNGKKPVNHLFTAFPAEAELSWMKPWFGGIRPTLHDPTANEGWPGKLHEETFTVSPAEMPDARGLPWKGVRLTAELTRQVFRGLRVEVTYLTLGDSNVLKVSYRLINETSVYRDVEPGVMGFLQVDGTHENATLHCDEFHRKRTPYNAWAVGGSWAAAENPDTGHAIVAVNASGWQRVQTIDWGEYGGHINCYEVTRVPPQGTHEIIAYFALVKSVAEARRYEVLKAAG